MKIHLYSKDPLLCLRSWDEAQHPLRSETLFLFELLELHRVGFATALVCQAAASRALPRSITGELQEHHFTSILSGGRSTALQAGNPVSRYDIAAEKGRELFIIKAQNWFFKFLQL